MTGVVRAHIREYASEFVGTLAVIAFVVPTIAFVYPSGSPAASIFPSIFLRLGIIGLAIGVASWLVALSPPGRLSGAHLNPALTFGYWVLGKMLWYDCLGYAAAQMAGAAAGAFIGVFLAGPHARAASDGALVPDAALHLSAIFALEVATTTVLTFAIYTFTSERRLRRYTPAMATCLLAALVMLDGQFSGAGMSPSRWFGPALADQRWAFWTAYAFGPPVGAAFAAGLRRLPFVRDRMPHTAKIVHDERYPSIFLHDSVPSTYRETA
jgi:aquaporin Z